MGKQECDVKCMSNVRSILKYHSVNLCELSQPQSDLRKHTMQEMSIKHLKNDADVFYFLKTRLHTMKL